VRSESHLRRLARRDVGHFLSLGFGTGLLPVAPGTWGTVAAIPVYLLLVVWGWPIYIGATAALFLLGVWLSERSARALGVHDHPAIVWDEIVGFLVTMVGSPVGWQWICGGFLLFRLFDILKPWPIGFIDDKLSGGWGIMLDDLLAGVYAAVVLATAAALLDTG